jgi:hypothetical protein
MMMASKSKGLRGGEGKESGNRVRLLSGVLSGFPPDSIPDFKLGLQSLTVLMVRGRESVI